MSLAGDLLDLVRASPDSRLACASRWSRVRLGDVADVKSGFAFGSRYFNDKEGLPLIRIRDLAGGGTRTFYSGHVPEGYEVANGDILVGLDGDFKAVRWSGGPALLNQRVARVRPYASAYRADLVDELLPAYLELIRENTSSVTVRHMSLGTLGDVPLPAPPIAEQEQIARSLASTATVLNEIAQALDSAVAHATGLRDRLEREQFFPADGWEELPLGSVGDLRAGLALGRSKTGGAQTETRPYLRTANVQRGWLDLAEIRTMELRPSEAAKVELRAGDVLMIEGGDRDKLGRGWVWNDEISGCVHQNHVFRLRLHASDRLTPQYVSRFGNSVGRAYFEQNAKQTSNLASISRRSIAALPIPVPPPGRALELDAQAESARTAAEDVFREVNQARLLLSAAKRSLTAAAASGRLSTPDATRAELAPIEPNPRRTTRPPAAIRDLTAKGRAAMVRTKPKHGRRALEETLRASGGTMTPETLFAGAGFLYGDVDEFYRVLNAAVQAGKIEETPDRRLRLLERGVAT